MDDKGNNGDKDLCYKDMNRILCLLKLHVFDYHEILTPITSYKYKKRNGIVWHPCIINYGLLLIEAAMDNNEFGKIQWPNERVGK